MVEKQGNQRQKESSQLQSVKAGGDENQSSETQRPQTLKTTSSSATLKLGQRKSKDSLDEESRD